MTDWAGVRLSDPNAPHWVYRCYDDAGRFIYVGCTIKLDRRLDNHKRGSWWAPQVVKVKATVHQNRMVGRSVEKRILRTEAPRWNIAGVWHWRFEWAESRYHDFVTALLHTNVVEGTQTAALLAEVRDEYLMRFGHEMADEPNGAAA